MEKRDDKLAFEYYTKSAAIDNNNASLLSLGYAHEHGFGTLIDYEKACYYYHRICYTYRHIRPVEEATAKAEGYLLGVAQKLIQDVATAGSAGELCGYVTTIQGSAIVYCGNHSHGICLADQGKSLIVASGFSLCTFNVSGTYLALNTTQDYIRGLCDIAPCPKDDKKVMACFANTIGKFSIFGSLVRDDSDDARWAFKPTSLVYDELGQQWILADSSTGYFYAPRGKVDVVGKVPIHPNQLVSMICPRQLGNLVFAADSMNHCIWCLDLTTQKISKVVNKVEGASGLAYDVPRGDLYISGKTCIWRCKAISIDADWFSVTKLLKPLCEIVSQYAVTFGEPQVFVGQAQPPTKSSTVTADGIVGARFKDPQGLAIDCARRRLYVYDTGHSAIRVVFLPSPIREHEKVYRIGSIKFI